MRFLWAIGKGGAARRRAPGVAGTLPGTSHGHCPNGTSSGLASVLPRPRDRPRRSRGMSNPRRTLALLASRLGARGGVGNAGGVAGPGVTACCSRLAAGAAARALRLGGGQGEGGQRLPARHRRRPALAAVRADARGARHRPAHRAAASHRIHDACERHAVRQRSRRRAHLHPARARSAASFGGEVLRRHGRLRASGIECPVAQRPCAGLLPARCDAVDALHGLRAADGDDGADVAVRECRDGEEWAASSRSTIPAGSCARRATPIPPSPTTS